MDQNQLCFQTFSGSYDISIFGRFGKNIGKYLQYNQDLNVIVNCGFDGENVIILSNLFQIWNVKSGEVKVRLHDTSCTGPINALTWMDGRIENTGHLILALHPPYHLILWDTSLGTKVWKKSYDTVSRIDYIHISGTANEKARAQV